MDLFDYGEPAISPCSLCNALMPLLPSLHSQDGILKLVIHSRELLVDMRDGCEQVIHEVVMVVDSTSTTTKTSICVKSQFWDFQSSIYVFLRRIKLGKATC